MVYLFTLVPSTSNKSALLTSKLKIKSASTLKTTVHHHLVFESEKHLKQVATPMQNLKRLFNFKPTTKKSRSARNVINLFRLQTPKYALVVTLTMNRILLLISQKKMSKNELQSETTCSSVMTLSTNFLKFSMRKIILDALNATLLMSLAS